MRVRCLIAGIGVYLLLLSSFAQAADRVTIRWATWHGAEAEVVDRKLIEEFEKSYPHIKVNFEAYVGGVSKYFEKLQIQMAGGDPPDVAFHFSNNMPQWHKLGAFENLRPYMETDPDKDEFNSVMGISMFTDKDDDTIDAIPWITTSFMLLYNKDLFDKEGIAYPREDWTFYDYREIAKKFTRDIDGDGRIDQWGGMNTMEWDYLIRWIWVPFGGYYVNSDFTKCGFDEPEAIEAFKFYQSLYTQQVFPSYSYGAAFGDKVLWQTGDIATLFHQQASLQMECNGAKFKWDVQHIPVGPIGKRVTRSASAANGMTALSKHKEEAWEFIKFASIEKGAEILLNMGVGTAYKPLLSKFYKELKSSKDLYISEGSFVHGRDVFVDSLEYAAGLVFPPNNSEIEKALAPHWDRLRLGIAPAEEIAKEMDEIVEKHLKEL